MSNIGRNDPCPCGSGKKYKKCCMSVHDVSVSGWCQILNLGLKRMPVMVDNSVLESKILKTYSPRNLICYNSIEVNQIGGIRCPSYDIS
jgi:hypothetical protein